MCRPRNYAPKESTQQRRISPAWHTRSATHVRIDRCAFVYSIAHACCAGPSGKFSANASKTQCIICESGQYQHLPSQPKCVVCPVGRYGPTRAHTSSRHDNVSITPLRLAKSPSLACALICPKGKFGFAPPEANMNGCADCGLGQYSDRNGVSKCISCPAGKLNTKATAHSCSVCPGGRFVAHHGASKCWSCPPGKHSVEKVMLHRKPVPIADAASWSEMLQLNKKKQNLLRTACISCRAGRFQLLASSLSCTKCRNGFYQTNKAALSCNRCANNNQAKRPSSGTECGCAAGKYNRLFSLIM